MRFQDIVDRVVHLSGRLHAIEVMGRRPADLPADADLHAAAWATEMELETFIRALPVGVLYRLLIILYVSKGYFENPTFLDAYDDVSRRFPKPAWAIDELFDCPPRLAGSLDYGLRLLHRDGIFMHEFEGTWTIETKK